MVACQSSLWFARDLVSPGPTIHALSHGPLFSITSVMGDLCECLCLYSEFQLLNSVFCFSNRISRFTVHVSYSGLRMNDHLQNQITEKFTADNNDQRNKQMPGYFTQGICFLHFRNQIAENRE